MKTFKTTLIITGIIFGMSLIFTQSLLAESKENQAKNINQNKAASLFQQELKKVEFNLIEKYLKDNPVEEKLPEKVYVYTIDGKCVFKGEKKNAVDLIDAGDYLFKQNNITWYVIKNR